MANQWLRLWHDMPNDPKWRTISLVSGQPIALVQAVYIHLLVSASQSVTRGHIDVTDEDLASHFVVTEENIQAVISAMQGRVLEGKYLTGWSQRQPKKEDCVNPETGAKSATQRKREQRERERNEKNQADVSRQSHDASRTVTTDKDKIRDIKDPPISPRGGMDEVDYQGVINAYNELLAGRLPAAESLNTKRKRNIKRLLGELSEPTVEAARNYFGAFVTHAKPFYFGENDTGWRANFDYLLRSETLVKTREGAL